MKLAIVQLSDIHIKSDGINPILDRKELLCNAIQNELLDEIECVFLITTGDIAYSGKKEEYDQALDFYLSIQSYLSDYIKKSVELIFIPGNHDCDFGNQLLTRNLIIDSLFNKEEISTNELREFIEQCCKPQLNYFDFVSCFENDISKAYGDQLYKVYQYRFQDKVISFNCYNSSWISQLKEKAGQMMFPIRNYASVTNNHKGDINISLIHHPLNWFQPNNTQEIRKHLEETSDLILTGHEHDQEVSAKQIHGEANIQYFRGGVLQDNYNSDNSSFTMFLLDLEQKKQKVYTYRWSTNLYSNKVSEWYSYIENKRIERAITTTEDFTKFLNNPGATFNHPRKSEIFLDDIFVYPNFREINNENENELSKPINSSEALDLGKQENIMIFGGERSGKSSLCKMIFKNYLQHGFVPIYLDGRKVKSAEHRDIRKYLEKAFKEQYGENNLERFTQLNNNKKLVIIDDYHNVQLNQKHRFILLERITQHYRVIVTADNMSKFDEYLSDSDTITSLFKSYEVMEFGHQSRMELINKWNTLGQESTIEQNQLLRMNDKSKSDIDAVIGRNYVPSYPFFLLAMLQMNEVGNRNELSSYGHYYDILIKANLLKINIGHDLELV